jgi:hypothetical protein
MPVKDLSAIVFGEKSCMGHAFEEKKKLLHRVESWDKSQRLKDHVDLGVVDRIKTEALNRAWRQGCSRLFVLPGDIKKRSIRRRTVRKSFTTSRCAAAQWTRSWPR